MKRSKIDIDFAKRMLYSIVFMSVFTIVLDLYVPLKMLISGDKLLFRDLLSHINYLNYFPFIFLGSTIVGLFSGKADGIKSDK